MACASCDVVFPWCIPSPKATLLTLLRSLPDHPQKSSPNGGFCERNSPWVWSFVSIVLIGTNTATGAELRATIWGMAKDENSNGSEPSSNGASQDPPGFTRFGFIDEADRIFVQAQHAAFREAGEELAAQGVDSTEE